MPSGGRRDWDLIVVGAGPAGSAAAIAALRSKPDARVLLLDRAPFGRDKVCGDGIAPHAVAELESLGVHAVRPEESVATVRLIGPSGGNAGAVTTSPGYVIRRAVFDARLLRAAMVAGAEFEVAKVASLERQGASVTLVNGRWRAPVVIGADGSNSVVRRLIGEPTNHGRSLAVAIRGYAPTPDGSKRELTIRWDSQRSGGLCYAWAFPVADGTTNVGYGLSSAAKEHSRAHLERRLGALLPEFDLEGVALTGHTLPLTVSRPRPAVGNVLLVGDAASLINPFTGEGIHSAIASGAMAGRAALSSAPGANYAAALHARFGRQYRQTTTLYRIIDFPLVLDTVIRAGRNDPRMFDRLLEVGLGDAAFTLADLARFGRYVF
ncbi:MAG: geranylgeranyl reductase family protein [Rhodoglobus sp.]|nr:geranylgeranyl reductase family protein [Rhodoglobus sp.]